MRSPIARVLLVSVFWLAGCGDNRSSPGVADAGVVDAPVASDAANLSCVSNGDVCDTSGVCCSSSCDPYAHVCTSAGGMCAESGMPCNVPTDCCGLDCRGGVCGTAVCASIGQPCAAGPECCTANCANGACEPIVPGGCLTLGNTCTDSSECCSLNCQGGVCARAFTCGSLGDICYVALDCCTAVCNIPDGLTAGTCGIINSTGAGGCMVAGQACTDGTNCCSRVCAPTALGGQVCQVTSGCRLEGEMCRQDSDCCGAPGSGLPGDGNSSCVLDPATNPAVGRCRNPTGCDPNGNVCGLDANARHDCCACDRHKIDCCKRDLNGVPRCVGADEACPDGYTGERPCCVEPGAQCSFSLECCDHVPCVPDALGVLRCLNAGSNDGGPVCIETGGVCTATSDCCAGLMCIIPPGALAGTCGTPPSNGDGGAGTCSLYGQACSTDQPCCEGGPPCLSVLGNAPCAAGATDCTCQYPPLE
jgi:hypothetical protein